MTNSEEEKPESASTATNEKLGSCLRAAAGEISLLYRLTNTIRRASKKSQNSKAAISYHIQDDDGNDAEPLLQELHANYICGRFPSIQDSLRQRLASSMVLRRKRILYRRSRYGGSPIRPKKTIPQPKIELPQRQVAVAPELPEELTEASLAPTKSAVQSLAVTATTLAADDYKRVSTPSVISATKTVALGNHEDLVFPPAPNGRVKQRYKILKKRREVAHEAYLKSLPGFPQYEEYLRKESSKPFAEREVLSAADIFTELSCKIAEAETRIQANLEDDWNNCNEAIAEVICPFCLYALPSLSVSDEKKWEYVTPALARQTEKLLYLYVY